MSDEMDIILMERIAKKDEASFELFVTSYQNKIINLIYNYTHSRSDAEELASDVFIKVWNSAGSFKARSKVSTWIYRIAANTAINHKRKKQLPSSSIDGFINISGNKIKKDIAAPDNKQPQSIMEKNDRSAIIQTAVEELSPQQKMAFVLSKYECRSYLEISQIMKLSVSSVESLLFRAKQKLKQILLPLREKGEI